MELLVILLGEFLFFPFVTAIAAVINLAVSIFCFIVELIVSLLGGAFEGKKKERPKPEVDIAKTVTYYKPLARVSLVIFACVIGCLAALNSFFFAPTVGYIVSTIAKNTNTDIMYTSVQGNFFTGQVEFENLELIKQGDSKFDVDFSVKSLALDIDAFSVLSNPIRLESLEIEGMLGTVWKKDVPQSVNDKKVRTIKAKKGFVIDVLSITDANIELFKHEDSLAIIELEKIESMPLRSRYAVFDIFFRSNIKGSIDERSILITSREEGQGRVTQWQLEDIPADLAGAYIDKAPLNWIKGGSVDINVQDQWSYGERAEIDMNWQTNFKDLKIEAPEGTSLKAKAVSLPFVAYIKSKNGSADLAFSLVMNENQFETAYSLDTAGLWDTAIESLSATAAKMAGAKKEQIKDGVNNTVDRFKNFLDKKREPNAQ